MAAQPTHPSYKIHKSHAHGAPFPDMYTRSPWETQAGRLTRRERRQLWAEEQRLGQQHQGGKHAARQRRKQRHGKDGAADGYRDEAAMRHDDKARGHGDDDGNARRHKSHSGHGGRHKSQHSHGRRRRNSFQQDWAHIMHHPFFHPRPSTPSPSSVSSSSSSSSSSLPPIDVFDTPVAYVVHLALPGTKRDDVSLAWHPDTSRLRISGCIRRPGDHLFLNTLVVPGRPVGAFDHSVTLPPPAAAPQQAVDSDISAEVDADYITAKMEDGILVVVVPKLARDWTEVRRVDIE